MLAKSRTSQQTWTVFMKYMMNLSGLNILFKLTMYSDAEGHQSS